MALITRIERHISAAVTCRFSHALPAVMAVPALPGHGRPVVEACAKEGGSIEVTGFARRIRHDVAGGFRRRDDAFAKRVAGIAIP
jgi:hypothetical protein